MRGQALEARVEMPPPHYDQGKLRAAWEEFPQYREEFLRIERIGPRRREVQKLMNLSGPPDLERLKERLQDAIEQSWRAPGVKVYEVKK